MGLPLLREPASPCAGCPAPCCRGHQVPVDGYDLFRLVRGLGLPWDDLVQLDPHRAPTPHGFRLATASHFYTFLLKRPPGDGPCRFLVEEPEGARCGAYALRPAACRVYPLIAADDEPEGSFVWGMARCDAERKRGFQALRPALRPLVEEDLAELQLYFRVVARWNAAVERVPGERPLPAEAYAAWVLGLYEALEPLRQPERGAWQPVAYQLVAEHPLPPSLQGS